MSSPQVTVLTAVRNGAAYLAETIVSIQNQTFTDWEYIIVDDASDDATVDIVRKFQHNDARISLLQRRSSAGPYVAANDGLAVARGAYIIRTDADDTSTPNRVERQLQFLRDFPQYRACVSYWQALTDQGVVPNAIAVAPENPRVFRWELLLRSPSLHSAVCYERAAINELGGYRALPLSQDYRLWCELTRRGWLGTIPEVLCYVRNHGNRESYTKTQLQLQLALDVLADHMFALTGEQWSREDLAALRTVGYNKPIAVKKGIQLLNRWDRLWQSATDLTPSDRKALSSFSAYRRWSLLRANVRTQPVAAFAGLFKLMTSKPHVLVPALKGTGL